MATRVVRRTIAQPADGTDFMVTISPALNTSDYGVSGSLVKGAVLVGLQPVQADRDNSQFRVITTDALSTGDILEFTLVEVVPYTRGSTLIVEGLATFTATDTVTVTYAGGATFAVPVVPDIGQAYTGGSGSVSFEITAYTTTGFTLVASGAFTGLVPYTVKGPSA